MGVRSNEIDAKRSFTAASTSARIGSKSRTGVENVTIVDFAFDEALTPLTPSIPSAAAAAICDSAEVGRATSKSPMCSAPSALTPRIRRAPGETPRMRAMSPSRARVTPTAMTGAEFQCRFPAASAMPDSGASISPAATVPKLANAAMPAQPSPTARSSRMRATTTAGPMREGRLRSRRVLIADDSFLDSHRTIPGRATAR